MTGQNKAWQNTDKSNLNHHLVRLRLLRVVFDSSLSLFNFRYRLRLRPFSNFFYNITKKNVEKCREISLLTTDTTFLDTFFSFRNISHVAQPAQILWCKKKMSKNVVATNSLLVRLWIIFCLALVLSLFHFSFQFIYGLSSKLCGSPSP